MDYPNKLKFGPQFKILGCLTLEAFHWTYHWSDFDCWGLWSCFWKWLDGFTSLNWVSIYFLTFSPAGKFLQGCTCRGRSCGTPLWTLIHLIHLFSCFSYHQLHRKLTKIYWLFACPGLLCKKDHHRKIFCSNQIFLKEMRCGTLWYRDARPAPRKLIFAVLICRNICREVMHFSE